MNQANKWLVGVVSATLITSVALWEGTKYYAYDDVGGVPTVCQGYTGKDVIRGKRYTPEECSDFLTKEVVIHSAGVLNCVNAPLSLNQYNAYTLFAYNVGVQGFCTSRALRLLNQGEYEASCKALSHSSDGRPVWSYVGDRFVQGLYNRRVYETAMCLGIPYVKPQNR